MTSGRLSHAWVAFIVLDTRDGCVCQALCGVLGQEADHHPLAALAASSATCPQPSCGQQRALINSTSIQSQKITTDPAPE